MTDLREQEMQSRMQDVIHADGTPVQVHKEKGRKNPAKSYMWVFSRGEYERLQGSQKKNEKNSVSSLKKRSSRLISRGFRAPSRESCRNPSSARPSSTP